MTYVYKRVGENTIFGSRIGLALDIDMARNVEVRRLKVIYTFKYDVRTGSVKTYFKITTNTHHAGRLSGNASVVSSNGV